MGDNDSMTSDQYVYVGTPITRVHSQTSGTSSAATSGERGGGAKRVNIQVLRALAVTLVFLYQMDLPLFKGGFIGVDISFVISGYLVFGSLVSLSFF